MRNEMSIRTGSRNAVCAVIVLMAVVFAVSAAGCGKGKKPAGSTVVPSSPEECITEENFVFYYHEAVVATQGGNTSKTYRLYSYTDTEAVLVQSTGGDGQDSRYDFVIVPASVLDDCMKLTRKYKMGKGKWLNGDGIVGMEFSVGFMKDGEYVIVTSDHIPDKGEEAFEAIEKVLDQAWYG